MITIITVRDVDGYYIPVAAGRTPDLASELFETFLKEDTTDLTHWDLTCKILTQVPFLEEK